MSNAGLQTSQELDPVHFDLWGSRLIEASAGTGKTWTIAALYVRLVLGHGGVHSFERALRPAEILVMTFTKAATRELSDRIRERLLQAAQAFRGEIQVKPDDDFLRALMADYEPGDARAGAAWALANAAQSMDDAAVHTIDAWCQRMLKEHAFDSGCLFDEALVADEEAMRIEAAQDYWRQECYDLNADDLSHVLEVWPSVQALVKDMRELQDQAFTPVPELTTLQTVLAHSLALREHAFQQLKTGWPERAQTMQDWLDAQTAVKNNGWDGRKLQATHVRRWLETLKNWASTPLDWTKPELNKGWERLTPQGLSEARKANTPDIDIAPEFQAFALLEPAIDQAPQIAPALRAHAAASVSKRLLQLKRQQGSFGFADMINRLHAALASSQGEALRKRILAQYPVILVDEFQDTSPLQYQIFNRLYQAKTNDPHSALLLIGDPKQSIYGFRGADIASYMQARLATTGRHYMLKTNYRSTQALVDVVNHWFDFAETHRAQGAFSYKQQASNPLPFEPVAALGRAEQLVCAHGPVPAMTLVHDLELRNADDTRQLFAARCAEQIVTWLADQQTCFAPSASQSAPRSDNKPLRPADIAVLVRTGKEATAVRQALARRAVASVYLSDKESVFESQEARDLLHWLRAVATPQNVRLVRAGLATATVGLQLDELEQLASQDEAFDARSAQLHQLHQVWQNQGVLAMLRQSVHQFGLATRWLQEPQGERKLTNLLHLAELLQTASSQIDGDQALIRWLKTEIDTQNAHNDEQIVRLESDADLVKVITIHKSKGLEYPVVCLPYLTSFRDKDRQNTSFISLTNDLGQRELLLQYSAEQLALADHDRLREDLRLLYVALTRARHALWVGFANIKARHGDHCVTHNSAAGYLLGGTAPVDAANWLGLLQHFAATCPQLLLQAGEADTPCTQLQPDHADTPLQAPVVYNAAFERDWNIGSFSKLARDLSQATPTSALSPLQILRPADDETPTLAQAASPALQTASPNHAVSWHQFTRGAQAGNFLHDQLEWLATERFALSSNAPLVARLTKRCERAGYGAHTETVVQWLTQVTQTRLPGPQVALADLTTVLPEMEFWLATEHMQAQDIDAQCCAHLLPGLDRPSLAERQLHGMLMGFADLVFEHQGKFWVLDYKSNHLGDQDADYTPDTLAQAMAAHRYDVQAAIYMLALHRLLKMRLGTQYQPEQHLGGAIYLFLRGINGPRQGVCLLPAPAPLLKALDAMLQQETPVL